MILSDKTSVKETFKVIDLYSKASGAKLNRNKSEIMSLGKGEITEEELKNLNIKKSKEVIQLLGIWIGRNKKLCENLNWENKIDKISKLLNFWKMRHLSLHGKVSVISSLLMSKLWYTLMVVDIPERFYQIFKNKCLNFLWNDKPPLIAYDIIINKTLKGGLNFPDILQKMYAFRLKFLSRFSDEEYTAIWKYTCQYFF